MVTARYLGEEKMSYYLMDIEFQFCKMKRDTERMGFPGRLADKESTCNAEGPGSLPESGTSPGEATGYPLQHSWAFLAAQTVKNLPTVWEAWLQSLGWEDPLEEGMANHFSLLACRIPRTEEPGGLQFMASQSDTIIHSTERMVVMLQKFINVF